MKASDIIRIAQGELGTSELPAGSNKVKYNQAYYGRNAGYEWCCVFCWWCFREAGASELFYGGGKTASCTTLMRWAKKQGQFVTSGYRPGDLALFQFDADSAADHIGIIIATNGDKLTTVEGNVSGKVKQCTRTVKQLHGALRPKYEPESAAAPQAPVPENREDGQELVLPELQKGDKGASVKALQILLVGNGFNCGSTGADGEFGKNTHAAVKAYQNHKGLAIDGIVGPKTWGALLL